jgi:hypothetical protein
VLKAKVMSAKVMDYEGIKALLEQAGAQFLRLSHLWLDAAYRGEDKGKDWVEKTLGWSVELELPPIGWQLFILGSSQSDSTAFPSFLAAYATRLLAEPLS